MYHLLGVDPHTRLADRTTGRLDSFRTMPTWSPRCSLNVPGLLVPSRLARWTIRRRRRRRGRCIRIAAGKVAVLAKTARNAIIGFVVLAYAIYWAGKGQAQTVENKAAFLWKKFPKFTLLGFLLISLLVGFHTFDKGQVASLGNLSKWAFLLTFAGVGLRTNFPGDVKARIAAVRRGRAGGNSDCMSYAGTGDWREPDLGFVVVGRGRDRSRRLLLNRAAGKNSRSSRGEFVSDGCAAFSPI